MHNQDHFKKGELNIVKQGLYVFQGTGVKYDVETKKNINVILISSTDYYKFNATI